MIVTKSKQNTHWKIYSIVLSMEQKYQFFPKADFVADFHFFWINDQTRAFVWSNSSVRLWYFTEGSLVRKKREQDGIGYCKCQSVSALLILVANF